jgi:hypothetical protein
LSSWPQKSGKIALHFPSPISPKKKNNQKASLML